jgi:hypothetical protein
VQKFDLPFLKKLLSFLIWLKSDHSLALLYWYVEEWDRDISEWEQVESCDFNQIVSFIDLENILTQRL